MHQAQTMLDKLQVDHKTPIQFLAVPPQHRFDFPSSILKHSSIFLSQAQYSTVITVPTGETFLSLLKQKYLMIVSCKLILSTLKLFVYINVLSALVDTF